MSEINVISRTQHIIIDPASTTVQVINGAPRGAVPESGLPVASGLSHRGTATTTVVVGASGTNILLDPTAGQIQKVGTDVEIVNAGAATYQMRVKQTGLYHVSGCIRVSGVAPAAGCLMGIRVNGNAVLRATWPSVAYASSNCGGPLYLNRDDLVSMFGYSTSGNIAIDPVTQSSIDPYSPRLDVWRVSTVQLI